jgi:hypothetical protein
LPEEEFRHFLHFRNNRHWASLQRMRQHLAQRKDTVEGLVIAHGADESIRYALTATQGVQLLLYEVDFRLKVAPT